MSIAELPPSEQEVPGETCPRCHTTQPWDGASWCPVCSYYPLADGNDEESSRSWADDLPDIVEEEEDTRGTIESIPIWFWAMLTGIVVLAGSSLAIRLSFPENKGLRGMIALIQAGTGLISAIMAHVIASYNALKDDRRLNLNDVLLSWFNIWQPTIAQLPKTAKRILAVVWGAAALLTAVTIIGGIDYSAPFRVHQQPNVNPMKLIGEVASTANQQRAGDAPPSIKDSMNDPAAEVSGTSPEQVGSMKDVLNELGGIEERVKSVGDDTANATTGADKQAGLPVYTTHCVVYGVEVDANRIPLALLLASRTNGKLLHVGRIERKEMPPDDFRYISVKLQKAVIRKPALPTDRAAIWVSPSIVCRISFNGVHANGELQNPEFEATVLSSDANFSTTTKRKAPAE